MCTAGILLLVCTMSVAAQTQTAKSAKKKTTKASAKPPVAKLANVSFAKHVAPIIHTYCMPCHAEEKMSPSELYLDSYDQLMQGGKHGASIVAGKADSSSFIRKISMKPPFGDPMPLKRKKPFPKDTLDILKAWINQGAKNN